MPARTLFTLPILWALVLAYPYLSSNGVNLTSIYTTWIYGICRRRIQTLAHDLLNFKTLPIPEDPGADSEGEGKSKRATKIQAC